MGLEFLVFLIPLLFGGSSEPSKPLPEPIDIPPPPEGETEIVVEQAADGTWRYAIWTTSVPSDVLHIDGPFATEAAARAAASNWLHGQQGGAAPEPTAPDVPPVCAMLILVEADGREATLCKQGNVWRIFRNADELLPHRYADPGKAAQRVIMLIQAATAQTIRITTPTANALIRRLGPNQYHWKVDSTTPQPGGGISVSSSSSGVEPTLLDAMGASYEAAGGL